MSVPTLPFLFLPYFRLELPGWGHLFRLTGGFSNEKWVGASTRSIRGKFHGYRMELNLSNWSERQTYFLGRFYDLPVQLLIREVVRPGDVVVDIGGNIGMITLMAARMASPRGRVVVFEPNPDALAKLRAVVEANDLGGTVHLLPFAASNEQGEAELKVITDHSGMGTLAEVVGREANLISRRHRIQMVRGDDHLGEFDAIPFIKIDVEGFEVRALRGLQETLVRTRPVVAAEVVPVHLERAGTSVEELFQIMDHLGYQAFGLMTRQQGLRHRLVLDPTSATDPRLHESTLNNVVWIHPESRNAEGLSQLTIGAP